MYKVKHRMKAWQKNKSIIRPVWVIEMYYSKQCHYCGKSLTHGTCTIDHVVPKAKGGKNEPSNCVPCCKECNQLKGISNYGDFKIGLLIANTCGTL